MSAGKPSPDQNIWPQVRQIIGPKRLTKSNARELRRMEPSSQLAAAKAMEACNDYTWPFVRALLAGTPFDCLRDDIANNQMASLGMPDEHRDLIVQDCEALHGAIDPLKEKLAPDLLRLVVLNGFVRKILSNETLVAFLQVNHPIELTSLRSVSAAIESSVRHFEEDPVYTRLDRGLSRKITGNTG